MILDKNKVKELYIRGYNAKEISNILFEKNKIHIKSDTIQRCINRNFSDLKFQHRKARCLNRDIKKSIDRMNNSFINNKSLLKYNRQAYNYNKNGNLVFDMKNGKKPIDIPRTFYKELI